jgi:3-oxoacyl-[acyl-carrier-protein] synthase-1
MIDRSGDPMPAALDGRLHPRLIGTDRCLALAETALREACSPLDGVPASHRLRLPLYLALPEPRPGFTDQDTEIIRAGCARVPNLPVEVSDVYVARHGHAGGLSLLASATHQIQQHALEACLIGGVDSYFHPDTMEWLDENRQLVGAVSRSGFVPGEGAAFCLVMGERTWTRLGLRPLARVRAVATDVETKLIKTTDVCLGRGLTSSVRQVVSGLRLPGEAITDVICDINSERYRAEEWGFVCLRLPEYFDDPADYWSPADCWGDVGAASGPLFMMLACQAAARGYAKGPRTLVWASSEGGLRGAAILDAIEN